MEDQRSGLGCILGSSNQVKGEGPANLEFIIRVCILDLGDQNYLEGLWNHRFLGPIPRDLNSASLGRDPDEQLGPDMGFGCNSEGNRRNRAFDPK